MNGLAPDIWRYINVSNNNNNNNNFEAQSGIWLVNQTRTVVPPQFQSLKAFRRYSKWFRVNVHLNLAAARL